MYYVFNETNKKGATMSKRENILVVDVETCGAQNNKVYDLGWAIVEKATKRIIESGSYAIAEVFYGCSREMRSAYYGEKLPQYFSGIRSGEWTVMPPLNARDIITAAMKRHNVKKVYAYNCKFDRNALNSTVRIVTENKFSYFFPYGTQFCDIWHIACQTTMKQRGFGRFARAHGFVSEKGNLRTSAEVCYAYITKNPEFEEDHTGLADVMIEIEILHHALRQKKRTKHGIISHPWRLVQEGA